MAVAERSVNKLEGREQRPSILDRLRHQPPGRLLIMPALIYAIIVTQAPFILTLYYSLLRWNLLRPERKGFIGLLNYQYIWEDSIFRTSVINSVLFTVAAVILSLLVGLFFAELVNYRFPGRGIVRTLLITPFLVMPVASALTWKNLMLDPNFGVIDWLLRKIQPGGSDWSPVWLAHFPRESIIAVLVWRWAPFMMLILLAGMQSISEEVREAARVDGATRWREFRDITLPHLNRFMQLGALLGTVYIVQEFDSIFMMTGGGPGNLTTDLPFYVYRKAIEGNNIGQGAAIGVVVVIMTIIAMTIFLRVLERMLRGSYAES